MKCGYCSCEMKSPGYVGQEACPNCGLVWEYEEGLAPTVESIRAYAEKVMKLERERCIKILEDRGYMLLAQRLKK